MHNKLFKKDFDFSVILRNYNVEQSRERQNIENICNFSFKQSDWLDAFIEQFHWSKNFFSLTSCMWRVPLIFCRASYLDCSTFCLLLTLHGSSKYVGLFLSGYITLYILSTCTESLPDKQPAVFEGFGALHKRSNYEWFSQHKASQWGCELKVEAVKSSKIISMFVFISILWLTKAAKL